MQQIRRAVRHPMWRAGCRSGVLIGVITGLCLPGALSWVGQQHSAVVEAQYEADFGPSRAMAAQQAASEMRYQEALGRYEASHGQQPVVGGKPRIADYGR